MPVLRIAAKYLDGVQEDIVPEVWGNVLRFDWKIGTMYEISKEKLLMGQKSVGHMSRGFTRDGHNTDTELVL